MPDKLAVAADAPVTIAMYREKIRVVAAANPAAFSLGVPFLQYLMLQMEAKRLGLDYPRDGDLGPYLVEMGVTTKITEQFKRSAAMQCLRDQVIRKRNKIAANAVITPALADDGWKELQKDYTPEYIGIDRPVVARVGGRNITQDEAVNYCLAVSEPKVLQSVLSVLVDEILLRQEAAKQKIDLKGNAPDAGVILSTILAPHLDENALKAWYLSKRNLFVILRAAHIFIAFEKNAAAASGKSTEALEFSEEAKAKARQKAAAILRQIRGGALSFEVAAQTYSDCPSASNGGVLGYLCHPDSPVYRLPEKFFLLDRTQIVPAPDERFFNELLALEDGKIGEMVEWAEGISIPKRLVARFPQQAPESILPYLKQWRLEIDGAALMQRLRQDRVKLLWQP